MDIFNSSGLTGRAVTRIALQFVVSASLGLLLAGCGSPDRSVDPSFTLNSSNTADSPVSSAGSMDALQNDPTLLHTPADVSYSVTLADTGLQVGLVGAIDPESFDFAFLENQWQHMQSCLQITAAPPIVYVSAERLEPFTPADDVLYNLDGNLIATSSTTSSGAVIQINVADFDGSLGNPGFHFRSISGRFLWLNEGLAERDYPFNCARTG